MKTLRQFSPLLASSAVVASLLFFSGTLRALGPVIVGNTGGVNGAATTNGVGRGTVPISGSRGGGIPAGNVGRPATAPTMTGTRSGVSFSNNAPRPAAGSFTRHPVVRPNLSTAYAPGTRIATPTANAPQTSYRSPLRPANAWSGTAVAATNRAFNRNQSPRQSYNPNGWNDRTPGQRLDPSVSGANLTANHSSNHWSHRGRFHFPYRGYGYPYTYDPTYAPYTGYYGGYYGAYPYYVDSTYLGVTGNFDNAPATVTPQPVDQGTDSSDDRPDPVPQPLARSRDGNAAVQPTVPINGPDSLVEAVQEELVRRGYFAGKVDAMFGPDTKEALRKFQQDRHLADSGLINEATLHALQLD